MTYLQLGLLVSSVTLAVATLFGSVVSVEQGTVHAVYNFGKAQTQVLNPGLNLVVPFITSTKAVDVSTKAMPEKFTSLTKDGQKIEVTATITYNVNPANIAETAENIILSGDRAKDAENINSIVLDPVVLASVKQVISQLTMGEIISAQATTSEGISKEINVRLKGQSIITVQTVAITGIVLSPQVQEAIEGKAIASQQQQAAIIKKDTARILAEQNDILSKSLTPQILQQKAIEKWDGNTLMFNLDSNGFNTPVILQAPSLPTAK